MPVLIDTSKKGAIAQFIKEKVQAGATIYLPSSIFTLYAFNELKDVIKKSNKVKFLFNKPTFIKKIKTTEKNVKEFQLQMSDREKSVSEFALEISMKNNLDQNAVANQCYLLLEDKMEIRSVTENHFFNDNGILIDNETGDSYLIQSSNLEFSMPGLGYSNQQKLGFAYALDDMTSVDSYRQFFDESWNNKEMVEDVKEELLKYISNLYKENSPELAYYITLYNLFNDKLVNEDEYAAITKYDGVEYKNIYPPIIKEDLFNAVQSRMVTYSVGAHSKDADLLLKGKVICGLCGHMMNGDCSTSRSGKLMHYYKCSGRKRGTGCESRILRQDKLDEFIVDVTKQVFCSKENIQLLVDKVIAVHKQRQKDESILNSLKSRHSDLVKSINNMLFALQEGIITPSTKERLNMLESDKAEIEEQIAKEELALSKQISRDEVEYYLRRAIKSSPKILLNNLVDKVIVYNDKIEIYYKYCHKIPDDPDDQRGYFFEELRIPINCGKSNRQFLPIMIDHQKMIAIVKYIINRRKKMLAPINYKKRPILASLNVTGADGYLLVETTGLEPVTPRM